MSNNRSKGFTLIELLVVIAIIGILSAVILASLNTARSKGNDAAVQSNLQTIQTQAALDYSGNNNSYGSTAVTSMSASVAIGTGSAGAAPVFGAAGDPTISNALNQAYSAASGNVVEYGSNGTAFFAEGKLSTGSYWCVDSAGDSKSETAVVPTNTTTYNCQ